MASFKVGQKVVCINFSNAWMDEVTHTPAVGPKIKEVVTVLTSFAQILSFNEFGESLYFHAKYFRPLEYTDSATMELINIKQISETSDKPLKVMGPLKELINN